MNSTISRKRNLISEHECYISMHHTEKLQILKADVHGPVLNKIIRARYKHKLSEIELIAEMKPFSLNCELNLPICLKALKYYDKCTNNCAYVVKSGDLHFIPIIRSILRVGVEMNLLNSIIDNKHHGYITKKYIEEFRENGTYGNDFNPFLDNNGLISWIEAYCFQNEINNKVFDRSKFFSYNIENVLSTFIIHSEESSKTLLSGLAKIKYIKPAITLENEILDILLKCHVIKFSKLMQLLIEKRTVSLINRSEKIVICYLDEIALLIRGLWVLKSEIYYKIYAPENSSDTLRHARDYVICMFYLGQSLVSKKVQSVTKLTSIESELILTQIAKRSNEVHNGQNLWQFPDHDYAFINSHQNINVHQIQIMNRKMNEIELIYNIEFINVSSMSDNLISRGKCRNCKISCSSLCENKQSIEILSKYIYTYDFSFPRKRVNSENINDFNTSFSSFDKTLSVLPVGLCPNEIEPYSQNIEKGDTMYELIKEFLENENRRLIIPVKDLSYKFYKEIFSNLNKNQLGHWANIREDQIVFEIGKYIQSLLEKVALKIDIKWPTIPEATEYQTLFFCTSNSEVIEDLKLLTKIHALLKEQGFFMLSDLSKALNTDIETKSFNRISRIQRREKIRKYCECIKKKYYLKFTVLKID